MRHDQLPRFFFVYELVLDFVSKYITMVLDANIVQLSAYYVFVTGSRFSKNVIILIFVLHTLHFQMHICWLQIW